MAVVLKAKVASAATKTTWFRVMSTAPGCIEPPRAPKGDLQRVCRGKSLKRGSRTAEWPSHRGDGVHATSPPIVGSTKCEVPTLTAACRTVGSMGGPGTEFAAITLCIGTRVAPPSGGWEEPHDLATCSSTLCGCCVCRNIGMRRRGQPPPWRQ